MRSLYKPLLWVLTLSGILSPKFPVQAMHFFAVKFLTFFFKLFCINVSLGHALNFFIPNKYQYFLGCEIFRNYFVVLIQLSNYLICELVDWLV